VKTERGPRGEAGFTLIEVLAAMVILSVGLLALEALGIGAARSVASADRQTRYTAVATRVMEGRQQEIRQSPGAVATGESCGADAASGLYVCSAAETSLSDASVPQHSALVSVRVARSEAGPFFTVSSYVYHPSLP
jgi:prepilin-type N-terminal cleavage/methylation domain-containing protein